MQDMVSVDIQNNAHTQSSEQTHARTAKTLNDLTFPSVQSMLFRFAYDVFFLSLFLWKCACRSICFYISRCIVSANGKNPSPIDSIKIDAIHTSDHFKIKGISFCFAAAAAAAAVVAVSLFVCCCHITMLFAFLRHSTHSRFHDCAACVLVVFFLSLIFPTFKRENYCYYKTKPQLNACTFCICRMF